MLPQTPYYYQPYTLPYFPDFPSIHITCVLCKVVHILYFDITWHSPNHLPDLKHVSKRLAREETTKLLTEVVTPKENINKPIFYQLVR